MGSIKVRIKFTEDILGTASNNPALHSEYIASKAPDAKSIEEEVASVGVEGVEEKTITVFSRNENGQPILWDYQIKGFFKDSCAALKKVSGTESGKIKAFKKEIDGLIFVSPRQIPITLSGEIGECQRPLRASTPQGERIALAHSEAIPAGSYVDIEINCLSDTHAAAVEEWLDYGTLRGIGQWRNSGKGRFTWERI